MAKKLTDLTPELTSLSNEIENIRESHSYLDNQKQTQLRLQRNRIAAARTAETVEQTQVHREQAGIDAAAARSAETAELTQQRLLQQDTLTTAAAWPPQPTRRRAWAENFALDYNPVTQYRVHQNSFMGRMSKKCSRCNALRWKDERPGICCNNGKVRLRPLSEDIPPVLTHLFQGANPDSEHFLGNIRKYNSCFQMTSFGAKTIDEPGFNPNFKVQGQVYHLIGSLLPIPGEQPQFLQINFMGDQQAEAERQRGIVEGVRLNVIRELQDVLHEINKYVRDFKTARERLPENTDDLRIVIHADKHPLCSNELQRISETHRAYDALQYPLIFWRGDDGYNFQLRQTDIRTGEPGTRKVSAMDFYASRLMVRDGSFNYIYMCRKLFLQFAVDMYAKIETERLSFIRHHQTRLRADDYIHLRYAVADDRNANQLSNVVILPSSFTGGPRYMHECTQDAMTYVRHYGRPDLFITFTCNSKWDEISNELLPCQQSYDRHDVVARVFHLNLKQLMDYITTGAIFGAVRCHMYTIEWQKRGLPHAHILIWLCDRIRPEQVDCVISAEIPNRVEDLELFEIVTKHMVHGPCGQLNPGSPCMKDGTCTKKYPKALIKDTVTGIDEYLLYRRRSDDDGGFTKQHTLRAVGEAYDITLDNRWIVPYCPLLLSKVFNTHINVEFCNSVKSIKYICKYVNKGSDQAVFGLERDGAQVDEVARYESGRYISANEAMWRIFSLPIHARHPTVQHLSVHLENGQRVYFTEANLQQQLQEPRDTTLTAFFKLCTLDDFARTLLYCQLPAYYTFDATTKCWKRRVHGAAVPDHSGIYQTDALARVYTVHPNNRECFFLRIMLHHVVGPMSFQHLRTVGGHVCATFHEACRRLGLLEDDAQWREALEEAATVRSPAQLRKLFAIMLSTCQLLTLFSCGKSLRNIWLKTSCFMSDNCFRINNCSLQIECSILLLYLSRTKCSRSQTTTSQFMDFPGLGGVVFLHAPGGSSKTFVTNLILAKVRESGKIALAVASSGIAATLLPGGRTANSALKLPLNLARTENPECNIKKNSGTAQLLQQCLLIVWDECTMSHKLAFEALNLTLKDLRENNRLFGGVTLLLSGDFCQTLPVIQRGTPADEMNAYIKA
ncbi:uncharacterized protein [Watersipora subatra]|uniref:uncharacterized protein n=1 Tax=Watersipora subatra TaxID=2589382 RepID=UPI00355B4980